MQVSLQNLSDLQNEHYKNPQLLSKGINSFIFQQIFSWLLAVDILGQCDSNIFDYLCTVYGTQCDLVIQTYCCLLPVYLTLGWHYWALYLYMKQIQVTIYMLWPSTVHIRYLYTHIQCSLNILNFCFKQIKKFSFSDYIQYELWIYFPSNAKLLS